MRVNELLEDIDVLQMINEKDINITCLEFDSRKVNPNSIFFCIIGEKVDGHIFAEEAIKKGAKVLVVERKLDINVMQIVVEDTRKAMAIISRNFYKCPDKGIKLVGITGTNGKTTTSYILKHVLTSSNKKVGVIGTNGCSFEDYSEDTGLTTPDSIQLFSIMRKMVDKGAEIIVMEVSAHAIALSKVYGLDFDIGVFTNLTQDHLDFFGNMENYFLVKKSYIENCDFKVINIDDPYCQRLNLTNVITYGLSNPADSFAIDCEVGLTSSEFTMNLFDDVKRVKFSLTSDYNIGNCLAACSVARKLGISFSDICDSLSKVPSVDGRLEIIKAKDFTVIVDYAHTPDGIEKILQFASKFKKKHLITLLGCGGFRDSLKRYEMGIIADRFSDFCVVTTDNPRYESEQNIVDAIAKGMTEGKYVKQPDRIKAVVTALINAKKGDIVVLCGKGRENYQDIKGQKTPYSEVDIVNNYIELQRERKK